MPLATESPLPDAPAPNATPSAVPIGAVLFDYGLVLTGPAHPPAWERMKRLLHADEAAFHAAYWRYRQDYDSGALSGEAYWRHIAEDLHGTSGTDFEAFFAADTDLWTQPNRPMIDWAASLQAAGIRTGILSNLGDAMEAGVLARCPWLSAFHHLTFSHRLRTVKPDPAIYRHAAEGLGVPPSQILFIDDREENVAGARAAGMQALRYLDHASFLNAMCDGGFGPLLHPAPVTL